MVPRPVCPVAQGPRATRYQQCALHPKLGCLQKVPSPIWGSPGAGTQILPPSVSLAGFDIQGLAMIMYKTHLPLVGMGDVGSHLVLWMFDVCAETQREDTMRLMV